MKTTERFKRNFSEPMEFWTSEDGTLMSLVIAPDPNGKCYEKLANHWVFSKEPWEPQRIKKRFAYLERVGAEYFDGGSGRRSGKVWRLTDDATDFPVLEYPLSKPR